MLNYISKTFFSKKLDFRVRLFNILAVAGVFVSLASAVASYFIGEPVAVAFIYLGFSALSAWLLWYAAKSGKYQLCYIITIIAVFMIGFPVFFFMTGAYFGTLPYFFIFAVVFTVFMLSGKKALAIAALELLVYAGICVYAYGRYTPDEHYMTSSLIVIDTVFSFVIVGATLGLCIFLHFRLYNRQQRELEAAWEESKRLGEVKNVFLANMSHEIRTPINVMLGMTEMVLRDAGDETVGDYARKIQSAGNMLLVLVSNLLDVSKIESGKLELSEGRYRTTDLIRELYEVGAENAGKKGLSFSVLADETLPAALWGDLLRLKQIASNFLSNAAKYTDAGSIVLSFARKETKVEGTIMLCISVSDTGIGIKDESLPLLFDAFARLDSPSGKYIEGTGLGLAISKDLAELMNGRITLVSEFGAGSEFLVEVPQVIVDGSPVEDWQTFRESADEGSENSFTAPEARILIVDDNADNLQTMEVLLRRTLARVDSASGGAECVDAVRESDYHIILMDYMMPGMDGAETLARLREEFPGFRVPVVAVTANAVAGVGEKLLGEGFDAFLTKPVQARVLEETLAEYLPPQLVAKRVISRNGWAAPDLKEALTRDLSACGVSLDDGLKNAGGDLSLLARMADVFTRNYADSLARWRAAYPNGGGEWGEGGFVAGSGGVSAGPDAAYPHEGGWGEGGAGPDAAYPNGSGAPDFDALRHLAHSLKSGAGFVGATGLQAAAQIVEQELTGAAGPQAATSAGGQVNADPARQGYDSAGRALNGGFTARHASCVLDPALNLMHLQWERAYMGLKAFAEHVHAVEPHPERGGGAGARRFDRDALVGYLDRRVRRGAIRELDLLAGELAGEYGGAYPSALAEIKTALEALDFDKAKQLLHKWEQPASPT